MIYAAFDPGKVNFAWCVCSDSSGGVQSGMLEFSSSNDPAKITESFDHAIDLFLAKHKPASVVLERYQSRGRASLNNEIINLLIGGAATKCRSFGCDVHLVMASTWKNAFRRKFGTRPNDCKHIRGKTIHETDAINMLAIMAQSMGARPLAITSLNTMAEASIAMGAIDSTKKQITDLRRSLPKSYR